MTCFERAGGEKCKMFQLNVRGEERRQLCVGTSVPGCKPRAAPQPHLAPVGRGGSLRGARQPWLLLGSRAISPRPRGACGYMYVGADPSLPRHGHLQASVGPPGSSSIWFSFCHQNILFAPNLPHTWHRDGPRCPPTSAQRLGSPTLFKRIGRFPCNREHLGLPFQIQIPHPLPLF